MRYPPFPLSHTIRISIMVSLISLFFVLSPILILYTAGYRYDFTQQAVVKTGVMNIDASPNDARVLVNDILIAQNFPIRIANLAPGIYHVKIEREGYKPWEKDISVEMKKTSYIKNIELLRESTPHAVLSDPEGKIHAGFPSADGNYMVLAFQTSTPSDIYLFDTQTHEQTWITNAPNTDFFQVSWSPHSSHAAIISQKASSTVIQLVDATRKNPTRQYTFPFYTLNDTIQWKKTGGTTPAVYVLVQDTVHELTMDGERSLGTVPKNTKAWYVDEGRILWVYNEEKRTFSTLKEDVVHFSMDEGALPITQIIDINKHRIIARNNDNFFIVPLKEDGKRETLVANHAIFNQTTKEWILWSQWEIWTVYDDGKIVLLNRTSERMLSLLPLDAFGVLLLGTEHNIVSFNPGYYYTQHIAAVEQLQVLGVEKKDRNIFFLGTLNGEHGVFEMSY